MIVSKRKSEENVESKKFKKIKSENSQSYGKKKSEVRKFDKSGQKNATLDKPPNWNEFKKQKKELKIKRKRSKTLYDVSVKAKQISEKLRKKNLEGGKEERDKLVIELHKMLGGKNNYVKFVLSHDMGRVVQYLLKFGRQDIRDDIAKELIPSTVLLIQSIYGKFCIKTLLKYGNTQIRTDILRACYGNAVKLASHSVSAHVFEFAYRTYGHPREKNHLIQEFFGDIYKKSKDDSIKHIRDVYEKSPDLKKAALDCTKANLQRVLNKKLLDSNLVQTVLSQYLSECSENDRSELLTQLAPHSVVLSNSKDGARVVMMIIWLGTNKDRKVAMKSLKEHILDLCRHETGHTTIIALLDAVDDTVLLNKTILSDILKNLLELAKDEWGRKVLLWLINPGCSKYFHPTFMNELQKGRENSTCKKPVETRREEIWNYSVTHFMDSIENESEKWLENTSMASIVANIIEKGNQNKTVLENISKIITNHEWKINDDEDKSILGIEHSGLQMVIKTMILNDSKIIGTESGLFSRVLCDHINPEMLEIWLKLNRGCFTLIAMLEKGPKDVQDKLKSILSSYIDLLGKQKNIGAQILLKKLQ
ncbi:protein penguin [Onthophagus taurus]|uniref:protein penguin n=1 Tax=Onthophagus taurus TaxID=166361 RepID=UPI0039BE856A